MDAGACHTNELEGLTRPESQRVQRHVDAIVSEKNKAGNKLKG